MSLFCISQHHFSHLISQSSTILTPKIMATPSTHSCALCGKSATAFCKGCKGLPDGDGGVIEIYYCSSVCQKKAWEEHKKDCKTAKGCQALFRAASLTKKVWLVFSKASWDNNFEYVNKEGDIWRVKPTLGPGGSKLVPWKVRSVDSCIKAVTQADVVVRKGEPSTRRMGARSDTVLEWL